MFIWATLRLGIDKIINGERGKRGLVANFLTIGHRFGVFLEGLAQRREELFRGEGRVFVEYGGELGYNMIDIRLVRCVFGEGVMGFVWVNVA